MKILRLQAENIKKIKAASITPDGHLIVIGGPNDAGKSSFLDSIEMALGGAGSLPKQPVRTGAKSGRVRLELGESIEIGPELIVKLTLTASGGRALSVENKDGFAAKAPQKLLDELYSALTFDPLEFERQDDKAQAETLRALVGLDTRDLDQQRQALYEERTTINRDVKACQIDVETLPRYTEAPAEAVSIAELAAELSRAEQLAKAAHDQKLAAARSKDAGVRLADELKRGEVKVEELEQELQQWRERVAACRAHASEHSEDYAVAVSAAEDSAAAVPDTTAIRSRLMDAEQINVKVRANRQRAEAVEGLDRTKAKAAGLTNQMTALDAERLARIAAVRFPVPGLGLDEFGVTFEGLPFSQASSSTRTLVSMSIAIAKNPRLRVALVRDGSLIGTEKLNLIADIAESTDSQVWVEMLQESRTDRTSVFIEDGSMVPEPVGG
jgi:hypothetical protein